MSDERAAMVEPRCVAVALGMCMDALAGVDTGGTAGEYGADVASVQRHTGVGDGVGAEDRARAGEPPLPTLTTFRPSITLR